MIPILIAFTWIGGFVSCCGAVGVAYLWMGPLLRFVWLDGKKKQQLKEDIERDRRKREEPP